MKARLRPSVIVPSVLVAAMACASRQAPRPNEIEDGVSFQKGAVFLTGSALGDGPGSLLGTMMGKVPNFRVRHVGNECPQITLRSNVTFMGVVNPHVYIDGTRATDTCVLESLRKEDVERVEVYPQGFTTRPGYGTHAHGLILVFMRSAE
ncbi:MAG: hypothetical protein HYW06_08195 [Gemmatimonadetes bacterium]|nr:hypothetical protein [Gemmatimonadota bacterium]MBI2614820.1 hypothetical protein [Gemmatimonadota bacterium]